MEFALYGLMVPPIAAAERMAHEPGPHGEAGKAYPAPKNRVGRWEFWEGRTVNDVLADCRAGRDPSLWPRRPQSPPAAPTRCASSHGSSSSARTSALLLGQYPSRATPPPTRARALLPEVKGEADNNSPEFKQALENSVETANPDEIRS